MAERPERSQRTDRDRALNRAAQARWRQANPDKVRRLQTAKPSYRSVTGESLGLGRPMTREETGRFGAARRWDR